MRQSIAMKLAWVIASMSILAATPARADVECPTPRAVELALWLDGIDRDVAVTVDQVDPSTVRVRAVRGGEVLVDRTVRRSADCDALADAIAMMVASALDALEPKPSPAPSPPPTSPRTVDVDTPATAANREIGVQSALLRPSARYTVSAALLAGAGVAVDAPVGGAYGELDVAFASRRDRGLRLALAREATGALTTTLERTAWTARAEWIGYRRSDALWIRGGVGAALVTSRVRDTDAMTTALRSHPALSGSLVAGVRVGARVSLRADASALAFPVSDRYRVGGQEVARSPRAVLSLGVGAQIDTDW